MLTDSSYSGQLKVITDSCRQRLPSIAQYIREYSYQRQRCVQRLYEFTGRQNSTGRLQKKDIRQPYHPPFYAYERGGETGTPMPYGLYRTANLYAQPPPLVTLVFDYSKKHLAGNAYLDRPTALFMPPWILLRPTSCAGRPATIACNRYCFLRQCRLEAV